MTAKFQTAFSNVFLERKCINFFWDLTEVCYYESNQQHSNIDLDNGLAPSGRQGTI